MIEDNNQVRLAETGLSFLLEEEDLEEFPEYIPPELWNKGNTKNMKSDIWALGICLYYFGEGCFPFTGSTSNQIQTAIRDTPLRFRFITDTNLKSLIELMLTKDQFKRISLDKIKVI